MARKKRIWRGSREYPVGMPVILEWRQTPSRPISCSHTDCRWSCTREEIADSPDEPWNDMGLLIPTRILYIVL